MVPCEEGLEVVDCIRTSVKDEKPSPSLALSPDKAGLTMSFPNDSGATEDDAESLSSLGDRASSETSFERESMLTSPTLRKMRTRTLEEPKSPLEHVASAERVMQNSDSMLEDVFVAEKLKLRLDSRREQMNRMTISDAGLSDFVLKSIMEGSLDAVSAVMPSNSSLMVAADMAFHTCMAGYFESIDDEDVAQKLKDIFVKSLVRVEFRRGDFLFKQGQTVDKLFVVEEGIVEFLCGDQVAGSAGVGSILGELSLVYGVPAPAHAKSITPCVIAWAMDALSFRRIQAVVAKESLKASSHEDEKEKEINKLRRQCSKLSDIQEGSKRFVSRDISLQQLQKIAMIGKGTFGSVYIVEDMNKSTSPERFYSLKSMSKNSVWENKNEKRVLVEKHALQELAGSPFIISLLGTYQDKYSIHFLTDFVQGGNLMRYMIKQDVLSHQECMFFSANLVSALSHIHGKGFVHRDLKPENCLIGRDGYLKLCDFGMAKRLPTIVHLPSGGTEVVARAFTHCGTMGFLAPEIAFSAGYNKGIDWWALGCILVEMYCGKSPFSDENPVEGYKRALLIGMGKEVFSPPALMLRPGMEHARDFAAKLLVKESERLGRNCSHEVQEHKYFSEIDFEQLRKKILEAPYIPWLKHIADSSHFDADRNPDDEKERESFWGDDEVFEGF